MRTTFSYMVFFLAFRMKILIDGRPSQMQSMKMWISFTAVNQADSIEMEIPNYLIRNCTKMIKAINQIQFTDCVREKKRVHRPPQLISFITFVSNFKNSPGKNLSTKIISGTKRGQMKQQRQQKQNGGSNTVVCLHMQKPHKYIKMGIRPNRSENTHTQQKMVPN